MTILTIDIGTSFSSAAIKQSDGTVKPIKAAGVSDYSIPSVAFVDGNGRLFIGQAAENLHNSNPKNYIKKFKAKFGTAWREEYNGVLVTPEELYKEFYRLFRDSCKQSGIIYDHIIATYPSNWTGSQMKLSKLREILREVFISLGEDKITIIEEPIAAMGVYPLDNVAKGSVLLIYDMGGGTLDTALAEYTDSGLMVIDSKGIDLGGFDFDIIIYDELIRLVQPDEHILSDIRFINMLDQKIPAVKKELSLHESYVDDIPAGTEYRHVELTRSRFNELIAPMMKKSDRLIRELLEASGYEKEDIYGILCVGGSTRIPYVAESVQKVTGKRPMISADPELAVCIGAGERASENAEEYFIKATEQNNADNYGEGVKWYLRAAELGHAPSENMLGRMYQEGLGVAKSDEEAAAWYIKAAEHGNMDAQCNLGCMYHEGIGTEKSYKKAAELFLKAAEQGQMNAQFFLGAMYDRGILPGGDKEAAKWYSMAAHQGEAVAQYNLAVMYREGLGVGQSYTEAIKWFRKAAKQGQGNAKDMLKDMGVDADDTEDSAGWSKSKVSEYAWHLIGTLKFKNFLGVRHFLPIHTWKEGFDKRLPGALTYAKLSSGEFPIYIYDYTVLGVSGKNGILAATEAVYFTHLEPPGKKCPWNTITSFKEFVIKTKSGESYNLPMPSDKSDQENLINLLNQMLKDFSPTQNNKEAL